MSTWNQKCNLVVSAQLTRVRATCFDACNVACRSQIISISMWFYAIWLRFVTFRYIYATLYFFILSINYNKKLIKWQANCFWVHNYWSTTGIKLNICFFSLIFIHADSLGWMVTGKSGQHFYAHPLGANII